MEYFGIPSTPDGKVLWNVMLRQHNVLQGCAEALPPEFIFQETTRSVVLIWVGSRMGRWQVEMSEQTDLERCSAGDAPKQKH